MCSTDKLTNTNTVNKNFKIKLKKKHFKKRPGIYIRNNVPYKRKLDLEEKNNNIVMIDNHFKNNME